MWNDVNGNGEQDVGESPLSGVVVTLQTCSGVVVASTTTLASGNYSFSNVAPGCYVEVFSTPTNFVPTVQNAPTVDPTTDSDINLAGKTTNLTLVAGTITQHVDAGFSQKTSIGDFVWLDANNDGLQDTTEFGLAGVAVNLTTCDGVSVATTTSDATGFYTFDELLPGCYNVSFGIPSSFATALQNVGGDDSKDSDVNAGGVVGGIMLAAGSPNRTIAAGFTGVPASTFFSSFFFFLFFFFFFFSFFSFLFFFSFFFFFVSFFFCLATHVHVHLDTRLCLLLHHLCFSHRR